MSRIIFPVFCWRLRSFIILKILQFSLDFAIPRDFMSIRVGLRVFLRRLRSRMDGLPDTLHRCLRRVTCGICHPDTTKPVALCSAFKNSQDSLVLLSILFTVTGFPEMSGGSHSLRSPFLWPSPSSVSRQCSLLSQPDLLSTSLQFVLAFHSFIG